MIAVGGYGDLSRWGEARQLDALPFYGTRRGPRRGGGGEGGEEIVGGRFDGMISGFFGT